jgi:hypothetical protein
MLMDIDSEALAEQRNYGQSDPVIALAVFRAARGKTVELLRGLGEDKLARPATFDSYGPATMRSLVHYLCSHDQQHLAGLQWLLGKIGAEKT